MFGVFRFVLSLLVVQAHVWEYSIYWAAWYAVFAFYTLSGFLMCFIIQEHYGFTKEGKTAFLINRFLRIYPIYYIIALLVLLHTLFIGPLAIPGPTQMPDRLSGYIPWIAIFGHTGFSYHTLSKFWPHTLVYNAWSLNIELACYGLLILIFGKNLQRQWMFFGFGLIAVLLFAFPKDPNGEMGPWRFQQHYGVLQAGFLPFAIGGLCYYYKDRLQPYTHYTPLWLIMALMFANVGLGQYFSFHCYISGLYISSLLTALFIIKYHNFRHSHGFLNRLDYKLGKLAYPIFLSHWAVAGILAYYFPTLTFKTTNALIIFTLLTLVLSMLLVKYIDEPIDQLRHKIRQLSHIK